MQDEPLITVQLPIYNEKYVAARLVKTVCEMEYPKEKMYIQVVDDSDDDTSVILEELIQEYKKKGYDIVHVRRPNRKGYKAGALKYATRSAKGDYIAIFDADFMPPRWFVRRALQYFSDPRIGLIQCRWGHINEDYSHLTQAQALSLDFHFLVEQRAKSNSHLFMNFNGTAGVWRRSCIEDAGGWHISTLVEDLDLSYRAQMKGWKCVFLPDIVVNAELPVQMNACKRQQFRWAKGSIQCAIKLLGDIIIKRAIPLTTKIQAFVQLTRHIVHPLMLVQFLFLPILLKSNVTLYPISFIPATTIIAYLALGPVAYLMIIRRMWGKNWKSKAKAYLYMIFWGAGMSVNNTVAVFDAMVGKKNEFLRTPKYGIMKKSDDWRDKAYSLPFSRTTLLEIFFGIYGIAGIMIAIYANKAVFVPVIGIQALGFLYITYLSVAHSRFKKPIVQPDTKLQPKDKIALNTQKFVTFGVIGIIVFGAVMAYNAYQTDVYPLERSRGFLERVQSSSDVRQIIADVNSVKILLPEDGNPVWIFPTATTDFGRIQEDLDEMIATAEAIQSVPRDSADFHTGIGELHGRALSINRHLFEAMPYMYVSISNIIFSSIWIAAIIGIFSVLNKKREQLKHYDAHEDV